MKTATATWYWANYGSCLQAYALQQVLLSHGIENVLIRHDLSGDFVARTKQRVRMAGFGAMSGWYARKVEGRVTSRPIVNQLDTRSAALASFVSDELRVTDRCYTSADFRDVTNDCDVLICGSDQIWNPTLVGFSPFYWLDVEPEFPRFSYAPSMGSLKLGKRECDIIKRYLSKYNAVSTRESSGADFINSLEIEGLTAQTVVDPTLLLDSNVWDEYVTEYEINNADRIIDEPYLFAYILRSNRQQREFASTLAGRLGVKLVTYPHLESGRLEPDEITWGDYQIFDDGPTAFLSRIKHAKVVLTDSFHCSVFSMLYGTEFYVLKKNADGGKMSQQGRIDALLRMAGLPDRTLKSLELERSDYDHTAVLARIAKARSSSAMFLDDALARCEEAVR